SLDLVTVKGAGHMVPRDRPGPALQMLANFLSRRDYSTPVGVSTAPTPLLPQYQVLELEATMMGGTSPDSLSPVEAISNPPTNGSKESDRVNTLTGLLFTTNSTQYSGYLNASDGVYLHYWLVEADREKATAPLLLWLGGGGPGCSSLTALLTG